jgi:hypothetical protein
MDLYKFINIFLKELTTHKILELSSIYIYIYFRILYNINSLFNNNLCEYNNLWRFKNQFSGQKHLQNYVIFLTHQTSCNLLFTNYSLNHLKSIDFNIAQVNNVDELVISFVKFIYDDNKKLLEQNLTNFEWGQPADYMGKPDYKPDNKLEWIPLVLPTGNFVLQLPTIDINYNNTFKVQQYNIVDQPVNNYDVIENKILEFKNKLPLSLEIENDINKIYKYSFYNNLNIVSYMCKLCQKLNIKFNIQLDNQILVLYKLSILAFNTYNIIFTLKHKYKIPRPITIIRNFYKNNNYRIWYNNQIGQGNIWLPINDFNIVCPPYPDCPNENSVFVTVLGLYLKSIFQSQNLFDKVTKINGRLLGCHYVTTKKFKYLTYLSGDKYKFNITIKDIDELMTNVIEAPSKLGISFGESCNIGKELGELIFTNLQKQ